jgi:hypothetical protein
MRKPGARRRPDALCSDGRDKLAECTKRLDGVERHASSPFRERLQS